MHLKILNVEVKNSGKQQDGEDVQTAIASLSCECAVFEVVFLFTKSGAFLPKNGRPIVKFQDYNRQNKKELVVGQTNYQALLYNRIIERLGEVKTLITSYLMQNEFIDATQLRQKSLSLFIAASQVKTVLQK